MCSWGAIKSFNVQSMFALSSQLQSRKNTVEVFHHALPIYLVWYSKRWNAKKSLFCDVITSVPYWSVKGGSGFTSHLKVSRGANRYDNFCSWIFSSFYILLGGLLGHGTLCMNWIACNWCINSRGQSSFFPASNWSG